MTIRTAVRQRTDPLTPRGRGADVGDGIVIDLFAGAGGWDLAARGLGFDPIGIELDADACATRATAGLRTIRADLTHYQLPATVDRVEGLIASPPCPAFSAAGDGRGRADIDHLVAELNDDSVGTWDLWWPHAEGGSYITTDSMLCVEALVWVDRCKPRWVALEQVPAVAPIWEAAARWLGRRHGYRTWVGVLDAANYGVPQNRKRAFLLARLDRAVHPPTATHARHPQPDLFGTCPEEWVTMAHALDLPTELDVDTGHNTVAATGIERYRRSVDRPATVTTKSCGAWVLNQYDQRTSSSGDPYRPARAIGEPASTITSKANRWYWQLDPREHHKPLRPLDRPGPTVTGSSVNNWVFRRPSTTVTTDPRIWPPGHRLNGGDIERLGETEARARYVDRAGSTAVKVTPAQAAALQTFPPDFGFCGSKTSQARQIGNAVPPLLAYHVLTAVINPPHGAHR